MSPRSPSAFFLSVTVHGLAVALIVLLGFWFRVKLPETVQVFELVAGAGDNYAATEAPALGNSETAEATGVAFTAPPRPAPPKPTVEAAPEPSPTVPEMPKTNFKQTIDKVADRQEAKVVAKYQKEKKVAEEKARKVEAEAEKKMTKAEYDKLHGSKTSPSHKAAPSGPIKTTKVDVRGIAGGVVGGTTTKAGAGGTALSRAEQDRLGTYFALLKQRLGQNHEKPSGISDQLRARASIFVAADGTLSQARIVQTSGSAEFDQSVLAAIRRTPSIGARPDDRGDTREVEFWMRDE